MKQVKNIKDTFDYALPNDWVDAIHNKYGIPFRIVIDSFVWLYDEKAKCFGRPFPINMAGWVVCKIAGIKWY